MQEDNDDFAIAAALSSAANGKDRQDLKSDCISETQTSEKLVASLPQRMHPTFTKISGEFDGKSTDRPAAFSFPLTSVSSTIVQPPTPTMPAPKPEISALTKEETLTPVFNSGSKDAPTAIFSLNTSDPSGFKSDRDHVSQSELSIRSTLFLKLILFLRNYEACMILDCFALNFTYIATQIFSPAMLLDCFLFQKKSNDNCTIISFDFLLLYTCGSTEKIKHSFSLQWT